MRDLAPYFEARRRAEATGAVARARLTGALFTLWAAVTDAMHLPGLVDWLTHLRRGDGR